MTESIHTFQQLVDTYLNAVYEGDLSHYTPSLIQQLICDGKKAASCT